MRAFLYFLTPLLIVTFFAIGCGQSQTSSTVLSDHDDADGFPLRTTVRVDIAMPDGSEDSCSGALVGENIIITHADCAYKFNDRFSGSGTFVHSATIKYMENNRLRSCEPRHVRIPTAYFRQENSDHALALFRIDGSSCADLGAVKGYLGLKASKVSEIVGEHFQVMGYSQERLMWLENVRIDGYYARSKRQLSIADDFAQYFLDRNIATGSLKGAPLVSYHRPSDSYVLRGMVQPGLRSALMIDRSLIQFYLKVANKKDFK